MKLAYETLRNILKKQIRFFGERPLRYILAQQILLEVVHQPSQAHKFYREKVGISSGKMSEVVQYLKSFGLLESNWHPKYSTRKTLTPTKQGIERIKGLLSLIQPKASIAKPTPIIRHQK